MSNMKTTILTVVAATAIAVSARAQQVIKLEPGLPVTLSSESTASAASGTGNVTYQWYRNGNPISGATSASYNLPANLANGINVEFKRGATSPSCNGYNFSNAIVITFCLNNLSVGNVCWADVNVDAPNTFAARPDMYTKLYQWNRLTAWAASGAVSGWNSTADNSSTWTVNPCPTGWRLPTYEEAKELFDGGVIWTNTSTTATSLRGNAVAGGFLGPNRASCTLPNNMTNCIFLSANGRRSNYGTLEYQTQTGRYWTSTQYNSSYGYLVAVDESGSYVGNEGKAWGEGIRCVQ